MSITVHQWWGSVESRLSPNSDLGSSDLQPVAQAVVVKDADADRQHTARRKLTQLQKRLFSGGSAPNFPAPVLTSRFQIDYRTASGNDFCTPNLNDAVPLIVKGATTEFVSECSNRANAGCHLTDHCQPFCGPQTRG